MERLRNFLNFGYYSGINADNISEFAPLVLFNPNRCNICYLFKARSTIRPISTDFPLNYRDCEKLLKCSGCKLIFYCSPEHQKFDWKLHKDFCHFIQNFLKNFNLDHPLDIITNKKCRANNGMFYINEFLRSFIEENLNRTMNVNEILCLTYTRSCANCNDFKPREKFLICEKCDAVVYCTEKCKKNDFSDHKTVCDQLKFAFSCFRNPYPFDLFNFKFECVQHAIDMLKIENLTEFLQNYYPNIIDMNDFPKNANVQMQIFKNCGKFSKAATLMFCLQICKVLQKCEECLIIHVITYILDKSHEFEMDEYKLMLSQMPKVKKLVIVYIGETFNLSGESVNKKQITFQNKEIEIETHFKKIQIHPYLWFDSKFGLINKPHFVMWPNIVCSKFLDKYDPLLEYCLSLYEIPFCFTSSCYDYAVFNKKSVKHISNMMEKRYETLMENYNNPFKCDAPFPVKTNKISTMQLNFYLDIIIPKYNPFEGIF